MSEELDPILQRKVLIKRLRNEVRFRHAVLADKELAGLLPKADALFIKRLNDGKLLDDADIQALVKRLMQ